MRARLAVSWLGGRSGSQLRGWGAKRAKSCIIDGSWIARREHPTARLATGAGRQRSAVHEGAPPSHMVGASNYVCMHPHGFHPHQCMAARQLGGQIFALDRTL